MHLLPSGGQVGAALVAEGQEGRATHSPRHLLILSGQVLGFPLSHLWISPSPILHRIERRVKRGGAGGRERLSLGDKEGHPRAEENIMWQEVKEVGTAPVGERSGGLSPGRERLCDENKTTATPPPSPANVD